MIALLLLLAQDPVRVPDGWRVQVLLQSPALRHPSAVEAAPDGTVYVAEDPMDMEGPVDARLGRVLRVGADGRVSVFLEKLGPVFGLAWHEGRLYVHDCGSVTAWRDEAGRAADPREILPATHPEPSKGNRYNTHIPAGFRLAPDGFFYMAVGDKGVPGIRCPDGSVFRMQGGGVLRFRPDGSGLEIVARGTRNILDVAVTPRGEFYVFDNDDNAFWGARILRVRPGGDFGYPWDRDRPWTTPALHESRGIPAGCVGFGDDVLLCDWGRSQVTRYRFDGDRILGREALVTRGAGEFRPVGLAARGASVYIADWATVARRSKVDAGRLLRLTRTGPPTPPAPFSAAAPPLRATSAADPVYELARTLLRHAGWDGAWWGSRAALNPRPWPTIEHEGTASIRTKLHAALAHEDPAARAAAAEGLAPDPRSRDLLRGRLTEERSPQVRRALFDGLTRAGAVDPGAFVAGLDPVLLSPACALLRDSGPALEALKKAREPGQIVELLGVLARLGPAEPARPLLRHADARVRSAAVDVLGARVCREAVPELLALGLEGRPALLRIPDLRAEEIYREALRGRDADARRLAGAALRSLSLSFEEPPKVDPALLLESSGGDPVRGRRLFHEAGRLGCSRCHQVGAEGGDVGPELTIIGAVYERRTLAEHILFPDKLIHGAYRSHLLKLRSGEVLSGVLRREDPDEIVLADADGRAIRVRRADVEERRVAERSIMPAGLADGLSAAEFADLLAYLESLKGDE